MIVGSFATVSAADYADVESTNSYYKAIQVLSGLGIAKGDEAGNFNPTADVKRSEMVTFICRAMGEEDIANGAAGANFTDVAANHWAAGYIAWGVNRGIINGMGDGTFAPDAPVKYQDAVVMIMRALGYDRIAQRAENGGYPTGYLKVASQAGVLTGAGYDATKAATREIIAQLTNNALTAPIVEVSQYGLNPEDDRYIIHDENAAGGLKCLLTTTNKIYRVRATVADSFLVNSDLIKEDGNLVKVAIDKALDYDMDVLEEAMDDVAVVGEEGDVIAEVEAIRTEIYAGASELGKAAVGETVELYITEDEDLNAWVALASVGSKGTVTTTVKYVDSVAAEDGDYVLTYRENASDSIKKAKEIDIDSTATVYINGEVTDTAVSALDAMIDDVASWTLVRPKSESKIQGVFLTIYKYATVKEVSVEKERIYFNEGTSLKLDKEARDNEKFFYNIYDAEGKAITLADVKVDDVLNILIPGNDETLGEADTLSIYVTSNVIEGSVKEIVEEEFEGEAFVKGTYVIEGEEYVSKRKLDANETGKFYISIDGKVIYVDTSVEINKNFAVVSYAEEDTKMGKSTFDMDLLTKDGKIETYTLASKVRIYDDADTYASYSATTPTTLKAKFDADIKPLKDGATALDRLITYKLNAAGEISEIRLPGAYGLLEGTVTGKWDADFSEISGLVAKDATYLIVPDEAFLASGGIDEDEVKVVSFADIANEYEFETDLTIFQTVREEEDGIFTFAIGTEDIENAWATAPLAVVTKTSTTSVDGDPAQKITFVQSGEVKSLTIEIGSEAEDTTLAIGDVFQYAVNADGEIDEVEVIVAYGETIALEDDTLDYTTDDYQFVIGYLAAAKDGTLKLAETLADEDDKAVFGAGVSYRAIEADANTYAKIDVYGLDRNDKAAIKAIELGDIEASKEAKEVVVVVAKLDENGKVADIVVYENVKESLVGFIEGTAPEAE